MVKFLLSHSIVLSLWTPVLLADDVETTCKTCHQTQSGEISNSVHASFECLNCHQGKSTYIVNTDTLAKLISRTPNSGLLFDHGSNFTGKLTRSAIPSLCGTCHSDVEMMSPFGLGTDQLSRYLTSGHGKTLSNDDDDRVAVCSDCHGVHDILASKNPQSRTHPLHIPDTCGRCHGDTQLMDAFDLPSQIVDEYRRSVHGQLLFEQQDTGAPTCATCHDHHSSVPLGFSAVGDVCAKCHQHAADNFATSIHASLPDHKGCVRCHGGGEEHYFHGIERITKPTGVLVRRYAHLLSTDANPTPEQITATIHAEPKQIITNVLSSCTDCHEELEDDESLPKLFSLIDAISEAERYYVQTAQRLDEIGRGVLLVKSQRFIFEEAKTHLIGLAPLQHTLNNQLVSEEVEKLTAVCDQVNEELDELEAGLNWRYRALFPIWAFALFFSMVMYVKYKQLKRQYVKPLH